MSDRPEDLLPLKPLVFQVLLALSGEERHGWDLVDEIQERTGWEKILPANFYRTLRRMLADGLIEDAGDGPRAAAEESGGPGAARGGGPNRRYFRLTALGREVVELEARRLQELVAEARTRRVLRPEAH